MNLKLDIFLIMVTAIASGCTAPVVVDEIELATEARAITQQFVGTLLPTLQTALQSGGPASAIEVCSVQAPAIADQLTQETGWLVKRVSLKPRNVDRAIPDAWERQQLESFDARQRAGEAGPTINHGGQEAGEYRYMQAQPVMPLCLTCHGSELSAEVRTALGRLYPDDVATGYSEGEIRGAISLRKAL